MQCAKPADFDLDLCHALTENQQDSTLFLDNDFHNIGIGILRHRVAPLAQQHSARSRCSQRRLRYDVVHRATFDHNRLPPLVIPQLPAPP